MLKGVNKIGQKYTMIDSIHMIARIFFTALRNRADEPDCDPVNVFPPPFKKYFQGQSGYAASGA
jgi:hypothetical protein